MCDYLVDDAPQAYKEVTRTARKEHRCEECGSTIVPGERYMYTSGVWDGSPGSHKTCSDCVRTLLAWEGASLQVCAEKPSYVFGDAGQGFAAFVEEHSAALGAIATRLQSRSPWL